MNTFLQLFYILKHYFHEAIQTVYYDTQGFKNEIEMEVYFRFKEDCIFSAQFGPNFHHGMVYLNRMFSKILPNV